MCVCTYFKMSIGVRGKYTRDTWLRAEIRGSREYRESMTQQKERRELWAKGEQARKTGAKGDC